MKKLGVLVLSYNHPQLTENSVNSVISYFSPEDIYLIHNGSLSKHREYLETKYKNINHVILKENRGYSGGINEGLKVAASQSEWILFLSNDCELESVGDLPLVPSLVAPQVLIRKTKHVDSVGAIFNPRNGTLAHCKSKEDFLSARQKNKFYVPGSSFIVHRDIILSGLHFEEAYGTYWEDVDFSVRVDQAGWPIIANEDFVVRHGIGKTCHKDPYYSLYLFQRNRKKVSWKYSRTAEKPLLVAKLAKDWLRLSWKLSRSQRFGDIDLLRKAALE